MTRIKKYLWGRPICQGLLKEIELSSATAWLAQDMLKAQPVLSDILSKAPQSNIWDEKIWDHNRKPISWDN